MEEIMTENKHIPVQISIEHCRRSYVFHNFAGFVEVTEALHWVLVLSINEGVQHWLSFWDLWAVLNSHLQEYEDQILTSSEPIIFSN